MEVALNSVVASSSSTRTTTINTLPGAVRQDKTNGGSNAVGLFNSGGGFKAENAITSSHGLALLASLTLKKALNVNNNNSNYNHQQQPNGFMNTQTNIFSFNSTVNNAAIATSSSSSSVTKITSSSNTSSSSKNHNSNKKSSIVSTLAAAAPTAATSSSITTNSAASSNLQSSSAAAAAPQPPTTTNNSGGGGGGGGNKHNFHIPSDILDDLASRFIINVPDMELSNLIRICFQIELAHWFYLDFFCAMEEEKKLHPVGIKQFAMQLFQHIPFLRKHLSSIDKILEDWKNYKLSVPTYGAILISEDLNYCLLVQSYFAKCSWGFPKGKINENEDPVHCATREVYEETGYDITELIAPNDYIEAVLNYQYTRLYIVRNVSLQTQFSPRTRNEIKCCDWFPIDSLPINKNDAISKAKLGINANSFFMIMPFVKRLKKWVNDKRLGIETRRKFSGGSQAAAAAAAAAGSSASPTSNSPLTTNMPIMAAGGNNTNNNNNQKHSNANNSCKKNKQQQPHNNDDKTNALNNGGVTSGGAGCSAANNTTSATILATNRSKRQRHKSMGDLDGIKLTNLSNNNNQSNYKSTTTTTTNGAASTSSTRATVPSSGLSSSSTSTTANAVGNSSNHNNINGGGGAGGNANNNSNHKRSSTKVVNSVSINCGSGGNSGSGSTSKRQLFHSQSQNGTTQQQQHGEKIVSSFDLIRKEKQQQLKAAAQAEKAAKAQKQQTQQIQQQQSNGNANTNNNGGGGGRVRAKSQSDKIGLQQQQHNTKHNSNANSNNTTTSNAKQRIQKQQSMIVTNSNLNGICMVNSVAGAVGGHKTPPPMSGSDLLALASAAAAATSSIRGPSPPLPTLLPLTTKSDGINSGPTTNGSAPKPRPSSVSLHFATPPTTTADTIQQLQRMASGTNLRILKRANSHQPQQQQQRQLPQQLKFTPSFNSWTNFSFTKNFIANVFC